MSTDPTLRSSLSRRRLRNNPATPPIAAPEPAEPVRIRWQAILSLAVLIGVLGLGGLGLSRALETRPPAGLAGCRPADQLAPRTFAAPPRLCIRTDKIYQVTIKTTKGDLIAILPAHDAPVTVNNFIVLALNGYYTGLNFWRNDAAFTQSGDPLGTGRGGPGYALPAEANTGSWSSPGALGMARNPDGTINGSQFFILKAAWPAGGPGLTVYNHFGTVIQGQELLKGMGADDRILGIAVSVQ